MTSMIEVHKMAFRQSIWLPHDNYSPADNVDLSSHMNIMTAVDHVQRRDVVR